MPRKSPYDDNDRHTQETDKIAREFNKNILPLFQKYVKEGYSVRLLSHLVMGEVWYIEAITMVQETIDALRKEKPPEVPVPGPGRQRMGENILPPKLPLPKPKRIKDVQGDTPPRGIKQP